MGEVDPHIWDRFDMVAVIAYTGHKNRQPALWAELERVGLKDRAEWFWSTPSPFSVRFANSVRLDPSVEDVGAFNCTMMHYWVLKTALETGRSSALVLEDDVFFLKSGPAVENAVRALPADFDLAKLEWNANGWCRAHGIGPGKPEGGAWWSRLSGVDTVGQAATAYSRRGMERKAELLELAAPYTELHARLECVDRYDKAANFRGLNAFVAYPLVAVQADYPGSMHGGNRKHYVKYAEGGSLDAYASPAT